MSDTRKTLHQSLMFNMLEIRVCSGWREDGVSSYRQKLASAHERSPPR